MSWEFRVGMKVVCVSKPVDKGLGTIMPGVGRVYTLREVGKSVGGDIVVKLEEVVNEPREYWSNKYGLLCGEVSYGARHFRPLRERKTDISIFRAILNGHRVPEEVS